MTNLTNEDLYFARVRKVCLTEIIFNYLLTIIKFIGGFISGSKTLISDGINSLGDIVSSTVFYIGGKISSKKADASHQFGHEKVESLICLFFATTILIATGFLIYENIISIINKSYLDSENGSYFIGLIMALVALFIKVFLFIFTYYNSKKTKSNLLKAQAIDHLGDSLSTFISVITLLVIYFVPNKNVYIIDPIASIIVGLIIIFSLMKILIDNSKILLDASVDKNTLIKIKEVILSVDGVYHIDALRTRMISNRILIEVEISCNGSLSLEQSHNISEEVRDKVLKSFSEVKHIIVHVNPLDHENENDL